MLAASKKPFHNILTSEGLQFRHDVNKRKRSESVTSMPISKKARRDGPRKSPVPGRVPEIGEKAQVSPLSDRNSVQGSNQPYLERASINLGAAPQFHVPIVPKESHDLDVPHQVAIQVTPDSSQAAQIRRSLEMLKEYNENPSNVKQTLPKVYTDGPRMSGTQERTRYDGQGFTMPPKSRILFDSWWLLAIKFMTIRTTWERVHFGPTCGMVKIAPL